ncbi:MAG: hypothetical protein ACYS30_23645 [Planctomycetota bacterium]|jgi:hypothetical protein
MAVTTKILGGNRALNIVYIVLFIVLTVLAIGGSVLTHRIEYVAGTRNDTHYSVVYGFGLSLMLFFIIAQLAVVASLLAIINLVLVLRHRNVGQILLKLALIPLGPVICYCAFEYTAPLAPVFLEGFEQWVLQEVDIEDIQQWLTSEGVKHTGQQYNAEEALSKGLPEYLVEINPKIISFSDSSSKNGPRVELIWFMFMDEYGLIVGPATMEMPEEGHIELRKDYYEFRRPVKPGAYVFSRG